MINTDRQSSLLIDPYEEFTRRTLHAELLKTDAELLNLEWNMCRLDAKHFINNWIDTYDPRTAPHDLPFRLWEFQSDLVNWVDDKYRSKNNGLIEKSRDMGVTWVCCAWIIHRFLFDRGFYCRLGSRKQELVDDGTLDSLFGKLRYMIKRLPWFLRPSNFTNQRENKFMHLSNFGRNNVIVGESMNIGFGRGGRSSIVFLDEFAHVQHSEAIWASIKSNSECIIALSTPNGKGNQFAWLRHESDIDVKSFHWTLHPKKTRDWYENEKLQLQPWQIAQELDLSYDKSTKGKIYTRFDNSFHVSKEVINYKPSYEQWITWDFGRAGAMVMIWIQIGPRGEIEVWNHVEICGQDIDFFLPIAKGTKPAHYPLLDLKDQKKVDFALSKIHPAVYEPQYINMCGDHAGTAKTANSARSCKQAIKQAGFSFLSSGKQGYDWRFECLDALLKINYNNKKSEFKSDFTISCDLKRLIDCMNNASWSSENIDSDTIKPKTDEYFHSVSALEFFAINKYPTRKATGISEGRFR